MRLFHYTNAQNARGILREGVILTGLERVKQGKSVRSIVVPDWDDVIDGVVWLTTERGGRQAWQHNDFKWAVRFEVEVPDESVMRWHDFAESVSFPEWYRDMLAYPGTKPETWWVTRSAVPKEAWRKVTMTEGERRVWREGEDTEPVAAFMDGEHEREQAAYRKLIRLIR